MSPFWVRMLWLLRELFEVIGIQVDAAKASLEYVSSISHLTSPSMNQYIHLIQALVIRWTMIVNQPQFTISGFSIKIACNIYALELFWVDSDIALFRKLSVILKQIVRSYNWYRLLKKTISWCKAFILVKCLNL